MQAGDLGARAHGHPKREALWQAQSLPVRTFCGGVRAGAKLPALEAPGRDGGCQPSAVEIQLVCAESAD